MGEIVNAVTSEYWTVQHKTQVLGYSEPQFWPRDGDQRWDSHEKAERAARRLLAIREEVRVLHVTQQIEYFPPIKRESVYDGDSKN